MSTKSFLISSSGLKNIVFISEDGSLDNNFRFIFRDQEVVMNRVLADFISPRVSHIHQIDPTIEKLEFYQSRITPNQSINQIFTSDLIENFKKMCNGYCIDINEEMSHKLRHLSFFLGNEEIFKKMNELFPYKDDDNNITLYLEYLQYFDDNEYVPSFFKEFVLKKNCL